MKIVTTNPPIVFNAYHHTASSHYFVAVLWSGRKIESHWGGEDWKQPYLTFVNNVLKYGG